MILSEDIMLKFYELVIEVEGARLPLIAKSVACRLFSHLSQDFRIFQQGTSDAQPLCPPERFFA